MITNIKPEERTVIIKIGNTAPMLFLLRPALNIPLRPDEDVGMKHTIASIGYLSILSTTMTGGSTHLAGRL